MPKYDEREQTTPVDECDARGRLNPDAVGWSRRPLHNCNLSGRWLRKKKWNYWCFTTERFIFSVTVANVDFAGLAFAYLIDMEKKQQIEKMVVTPFGAGINLPTTVEADIEFKHRAMPYTIQYRGEEIILHFNCPNLGGKRVEADLVIDYPKTHETLSVIIPWSPALYQYTSKHNTLRTRGTVRVDNEVCEFKPEDSYAILDYGRGVWPYSVRWNWASFSGMCDGDLVGLQFGGQWTDGTGANENGLCINGKLFKISEDMVFSYNNKNFMEPWTIKTEITDTVDLVLTPEFERGSKFNIGVLRTESHQLFGHVSGTVRADGRIIKINQLLGWSEEHIGLW